MEQAKRDQGRACSAGFALDGRRRRAMGGSGSEMNTEALATVSHQRKRSGAMDRIAAMGKADAVLPYDL